MFRIENHNTRVYTYVAHHFSTNLKRTGHMPVGSGDKSIASEGPLDFGSATAETRWPLRNTQADQPALEVRDNFLKVLQETANPQLPFPPLQLPPFPCLPFVFCSVPEAAVRVCLRVRVSTCECTCDPHLLFVCRDVYLCFHILSQAQSLLGSRLARST